MDILKRIEKNQQEHKLLYRKLVIYFVSKDWSSSDSIFKHECKNPEIYYENQLVHFFCKNCNWSLQNSSHVFQLLGEDISTIICNVCEGLELFPDPFFKALCLYERKKNAGK